MHGTELLLGKNIDNKKLGAYRSRCIRRLLTRILVSAVPLAQKLTANV